ncbi:ABC transporter [Bordetella petrii]|nr:ABC transporter [Bordetella petrii]
MMPILAPGNLLITVIRACLPAALLLLPGCTLLPASETLTFYRLPPSQIAAQGDAGQRQAPMHAVLRINTPDGNRSIDSTRILVVPEADRVSSYYGARWNDRAPVLLRDRLIESFRDAGIFRAVVTDSGNLGADVELSGDLSQFHVIYRSGSPVVVIVFEAALVDPASSRILAARRFHAEQPVRGKEVPEVVQAFGPAIDQLTVQLLAWTRDTAMRLQLSSD